MKSKPIYCSKFKKEGWVAKLEEWMAKLNGWVAMAKLDRKGVRIQEFITNPESAT
jgi:hypothetical protein